MAQATESGEIKYYSFPRMIHFNEQDPLKTISMKVFKTVRPLLVGNDPNQPENEAYQALFTEGQAYEMVLLLKDGKRWQIDPTQHQTKKLS